MGYDAPLGSIMSGPFPATGLSSLYANKFTGNTRADSGDVYASGPFSLLGRTHELVIGASASNSHWTGKDYGAPTYVGNNEIDFWNFDGNAPEPNWGERHGSSMPRPANPQAIWPHVSTSWMT